MIAAIMQPITPATPVMRDQRSTRYQPAGMVNVTSRTWALVLNAALLEASAADLAAAAAAWENDSSLPVATAGLEAWSAADWRAPADFVACRSRCPCFGLRRRKRVWPAHP